MHRLAGILLVALGVLACGQVSGDPPPGDDPPAPGGACSDVGATAPAEDGCNTCTCGEEGWSCTLLACPPDDSCTEGSTKPAEDGCNTCTCQSGTWLCTLMPCIEPVCEEGTHAAEGCNTCTCTDATWVCTDVYCPPPCEAGTVKSAGDGCNTCACDASGEWTCTEESCPEPACPVPDGLPEQDCTGSALYGRSAGADACCELCYSLAGYTYYESMEACEASKVCTPGETKYADDDCNTCTCSWDGTWACTSADCEPVYCGGLGGTSCTEDEYCAYEANEGACGVGDANAICRPRPTECPEEEAPVCGCDGETYSNACLANMAGMGLMTDQPCP